MQLVILVVTLALVQFIYFGIRVGSARLKYNIPAPAMSGHPVFERHLRVEQNTKEQLLVFIPAIFMFAWQGQQVGVPYATEGAAALGVIWLIGRGLYARAYVRDPQRRGPGFMLTALPSMLLLLATLVAVFRSLL
ncbi:MAG: hypothetical protein RLZZ169_1760 [Pseudomonadota bacterium]|jgi:glutathione S-transferase